MEKRSHLKSQRNRRRGLKRRDFLVAGGALATTAAGLRSVFGGRPGPWLGLEREPTRKPKDLSYVTINDDPNYSTAEVNVEKLRNGDLVATFQQTIKDHDTGNILMVRSRDQGKTWDQSRAVTVFPRSEDFGHNLAGITQLSDGTLIANTMQFLASKEVESIYVRKSVDNGYTWGEKLKVNIAPFWVAWVRDSILEMPDGTLLLPLCGLKTERSFSYSSGLSEPLWSFLLRSEDKGDSWHYWGVMAIDPAGIITLEEPAVVRLRDGRLLAMLRSHTRPRRDPPGGYLYRAVSEDGGSTFSPAQRTELWGYPADLINLKDGRVLCVYGYRRYPNPGIRGCVSEDGVSWKAENIFVIKAIPDLDPRHIHIGYPSTLQLDEGTILTAYHVWKKGTARGFPGPEDGWKQYVEGALYRLE